uniref:C-type lectin domain-containing protein n=1 Tax=Anabas testudineus TaxID=64144 RepID=A0A3Q1I5F1_ANATE
MGKWIKFTDIKYFPFVYFLVTVVIKSNFFRAETKQSNKSFHLISYTLTWPQAQRYCRENHTDLVSGLDQLDDNSVKSGSDVWIGVFRDTWRWSDGSSFSFRNWEYVEDLVDGQSNKTCATTVLNRAGKWSSADCNEEKPFICYDEA